MALLEKPPGSSATAGSARESCGASDRTLRRPSPLAARTAVLLQRLRSQACGAAAVGAPGSMQLDDADLNRVQLTGCLGSEPLLYDVGDHPVATFALACKRRWRDADDRLQVETTWINLSAMEELAEQCGRLLHQGDRVYVEGSLQLWTEVQAPQCYACHTVIVERIVLLAASRAASACSRNSS